MLAEQSVRCTRACHPRSPRSATTYVDGSAALLHQRWAHDKRRVHARQVEVLLRRQRPVEVPRGALGQDFALSVQHAGATCEQGNVRTYRAATSNIASTLGYGPAFSGIVQSFSVNTRPFTYLCPSATARAHARLSYPSHRGGTSRCGHVPDTMDDVNTTCLTAPFVAAHAFSTLVVPSTAVRTISASLMSPMMKGDAICCTYVHPFTAACHASALSKSSSTCACGGIGQTLDQANTADATEHAPALARAWHQGRWLSAMRPSWRSWCCVWCHGHCERTETG